MRRSSGLVMINSIVREYERSARNSERLRKQEARQNHLNYIENCKDDAEFKTEEAEEDINSIQNLLLNSLDEEYDIDWNKYKNNDDFNRLKPDNQILELPQKPKKRHYKIFLIFFNKERKIKEKLKKYKVDLFNWKTELFETAKKQKKLDEKFAKELEIWENEKNDFYNKQKIFNENIDKYEKEFANGNSESISTYYYFLFNEKINPENFPNKANILYNDQNQILIVDYFLPILENLPKLKSVKFVKTDLEFKETYYSESFMKKLYDNLIYQIIFKILNIIYKKDISNSISSIIFNGYVDTIDKAIGKEITPCIVTVQIKKEEFNELNLANIDPKQAFKKLKGISCSQLEEITPVCPILSINKEDKRFIKSYNVINSVNLGTNLATLDWQDFENLVRDIFEQEFNQSGGEVKITQASRDGGIDAVVFDPDPIKGGKIVIQAKRYTNTVGVSAVRDLYGTLMNEGAMKGILITTSDYGHDAYNFAKDKPITLLNGGNLLHLLEKYGHKAYIDIKEAKKLVSSNY